MPEFKQTSVVIVQGILDPLARHKISLKKHDALVMLEGGPCFEAARENSAFLLKKGFRPLVISDNMAGLFFYKGWVKSVYLACQCADKTGALVDTGGLILGVLAKKHRVPVILLKAKPKQRFLGEPASVAGPTVPGYVPLVEWVPSKYLVFKGARGTKIAQGLVKI